MKFVLNAVLIVVIVLITAIILTRIMKVVMKVGNYKTKEFKIVNSDFKDWESVFAQPGNITIETLHAGDVTGTVHGIINAKDENAAGLQDSALKAPLFAHLIHHEKYGDFIIDTGFDSSFEEKPWGNFEGLLKKGAFKYSVKKGLGIERQLAEKKIQLKYVFCTHFHEHQGGAPALPHDIPFIFGKGEKEIDLFPIAYGNFLKEKKNLQAIDFDKAAEMPLLGKTVDIFGDGSFWAISTPGHTNGHISYLVNGKSGKAMIIGDVSMCRKGFELGVESGGKYASNQNDNKKSFLKLKKFIEAYPETKPIFGHETEEYPITYFQ